MWATDCGNPWRLGRGLPRTEYSSRGLPQTEVWIWERIAIGLTWSQQPEHGTWQSTVHLRAVCQEVIPVVAIHGIWPQNLANDQIPAPAILHRQFPCLLCHKLLTRNFLGVRQIRGRLFRAKLYTNGLSWQTILWYYPFNNDLLSFPLQEANSTTEPHWEGISRWDKVKETNIMLNYWTHIRKYIEKAISDSYN
jgi:hypothetical protein